MTLLEAKNRLRECQNMVGVTFGNMEVANVLIVPLNDNGDIFNNIVNLLIEDEHKSYDHIIRNYKDFKLVAISDLRGFINGDFLITENVDILLRDYPQNQ